MASDYLTTYIDHLETWGPSCGAPKAVYAGHIDILIAAAIAAEREECAKIAERHKPTGPSPIGPLFGAGIAAGAEAIAAAIRARMR